MGKRNLPLCCCFFLCYKDKVKQSQKAINLIIFFHFYIFYINMIDKLQIRKKNVESIDNSINEGQRLKAVIADTGMSIRKFALKIGLSQTIVSQVITGVKPMSVNMVNRIRNEMPRYNADWILTGEGSMFTDNYTARIDSAGYLEALNAERSKNQELTERLDKIQKERDTLFSMLQKLMNTN